MTESTALSVTEQATALMTLSDSLFFNVSLFEHAQRVAKMLSCSSMVPQHFRGPENVGNVLIALNYAQRIKADPFMVLQSMYVVHGRPGIEGKLAIALVNQCGRFEPLQFEEDPTGCTAYARELRSGKILRGPKITMQMVKAEGWLDKQGSKWQTMPEVMFRYRSAAFFARTYCPEVLLGMQTKEELEDIINLHPVPESVEKNAPIWEPELPPAVEPQEDFRGRIIRDTGVSEASLNEFLDALVRHYKKPIDAVLDQAVDNLDSFEASLKNWAARQPHAAEEPQAKQPVQTTAQGEKAPQRGQELPQAPDGKESPDPWQAFRQEFINLRNAGFSTWIIKNRDRLAQAPKEIQQEAREKWSKLYPANRWPLDVEGAPEPQPALFESGQTPAVDFQTGEITKIVCPERDGKTVPVEDCDVCDMRDSCPSWRNDDE
jgi:hypothetical protein